MVLAPVAQTLTWDTEDHDPHGMHAANDSKLTAPVAGLYHVEAAFQAVVYGPISGASVISTQCRIRKNGNTFIACGPMTTHYYYMANQQLGSSVSADILLAAGDYIEVQTIQFSNGGGDGHADIDTSLPTGTYVSCHLVSTV